MYIPNGEGFEFLCRSEDLVRSYTRNVRFCVNSFLMDRDKKIVIADVIIVLD